MVKKHTTQFVRTEFEKAGYKLDDDFEYIGNKEKINFTCDMGHQYNISFSSFQDGRRCFYCGHKKTTEKSKLDEDFVKKQFEKHSYILDDNFKYDNSHAKINFTCPNGHKHSMSFNTFKQGHRCKFCHDKKRSKHQKLDENFIKKYFEKNGYKLDEKFYYVNVHKKINFTCPNNHKHSITWNDFKMGKRCGKCFTEKHHSYHDFFKSSIYLRIYQKAKIKNKNLTRKQFDEWVKEDESNIDINALIEIYNNCPKGYHVDHIIPCSYFDFTDMNQIYHCWKPINLRYLEATENFSRGNRMSYKDFKQLIQGNEQLTNLFFMAQNKPEKLMYQIGCI